MKTTNGKGSQTPTQKQIDSLMADVEELASRVSTFTVNLSSAERLASLKMRVGGEQVIATVGQLADQHHLALPEISVSKMNAALALAQRLRPAAKAVQELARRLDDTVISANSEAWNAATTLYTALARSASTSPTIEASLRPVVTFFSTGPRKKAVVMPTPPA